MRHAYVFWSKIILDYLQKLVDVWIPVCYYTYIEAKRRQLKENTMKDYANKSGLKANTSDLKAILLMIVIWLSFCFVFAVGSVL